MARRNSQMALLKKEKLAYGGDLMRTRAGRVGRRPLATRNSMHLVLRSSKAKGEWSFTRPKHRKAIETIVRKFSLKYGVRVRSLAIVGNHLHVHIQLMNLFTYKPFIRAVTSAIAMAVTNINRWTKAARQRGHAKADLSKKLRFWDYRPFTRVIANGLRSFLALRDYIRINKLEGFGFSREVAHIIVREEAGKRSTA